jgi:hypothetical protein
MKYTLKVEIENVYSNSELADLLSVENNSLSGGLPELCAALLLSLTIPVMATSVECSCTELKLSKNYCLCTMSQE